LIEEMERIINAYPEIAPPNTKQFTEDAIREKLDRTLRMIERRKKFLEEKSNS